MRIPVTKYHGLGNDFIIVNERDVQELEYSELAIKVCDRHTGIGADGLIVVQQQPLTMIYYNSDGSRAKMCGNGIRSMAAFLYDHNMLLSKGFTINTLAGPYQLTITNESPFQVKVNMKQPSFVAMDVPVVSKEDTFINQPITYEGITYYLTSLFMGTVHTVIEVNDIDQVDLVSVGSYIQSLDIFPDSTNVNFYQTLEDGSIKMQTYERGAGLTLACGTGATAVYSVLNKLQNRTEQTIFHLPLGELYLSIEQNNIYMEGPAMHILSGTVQM